MTKCFNRDVNAACSIFTDLLVQIKVVVALHKDFKLKCRIICRTKNHDDELHFVVNDNNEGIFLRILKENNESEILAVYSYDDLNTIPKAIQNDAILNIIKKCVKIELETYNIPDNMNKT